MPAFWWLFNMYALARNNWKFQSRDNRIHKIQNIEFDCMAPDTAEEIFQAMELLELWTGKAHLRRQGRTPETEPLEKIIALGRSLLTGDGKNLADLEVLGERIEKSHRKAVILKPYEGYHAYRQMLHHYAIKNLLAWMEANPSADWTLLQNRLHGPRCRHWVNLGGQLMLAEDVDQLRADIRDGKLQTWQQIHNRYDELWQRYPLDKQKHAFATLCALCGSETFTPQQWKELFRQAVQIQQLICDRVYASRKKDYENPFRQATYRNQEEMLAVLGPLEENDFVKRVRQQTEQFKAAVEAVLHRD